MTRTFTRLPPLCLRALYLLASAGFLGSSAWGADAFDPAAARIAAPQGGAIQAQLEGWFKAANPGTAEQRAAALASLAALPESASAADRLEALVAAIAQVEPRAATLVAVCQQPRAAIKLPDVAWLADEATAPVVRHNLRLLYGRWLVRERMFDEALAQLDGLAATEVVDPAGLLFHQGVVYQRLLRKEPGLQALGRLVNETRDPPRRYVALAQSMLAELRELKDDSLDHIARRMDDIERRLDLGHAGPKVREVEDGVIASLDKLIEQLEEEAKKKQGGGGGGAGSIRSSSPAQDSTPMGGKGPGEVEQKPLGNSAGWGDLPPKQREEAMQVIGKDFPSHYRDAIEQYFRKLAGADTAEE